jgi:predicted metalloprotease with PDZ domain
VVHALFALCKDSKPGFEEDEIRKQCIRFGGPSLGPFYDKVITKAGQMPIEAQLAKMGLMLKETDQPFVDIGFAAAPVRGGRGLRVSAVRSNGQGKLETGDIILGINGKSTDTEDLRSAGQTFSELQSKATVGAVISLKVKRGDSTMDVEVTPVSSTKKVHSVEEDPAATKSQVALREGWLKNKTAAGL